MARGCHRGGIGRCALLGLGLLGGRRWSEGRGLPLDHLVGRGHAGRSDYGGGPHHGNPARDAGSHKGVEVPVRGDPVRRGWHRDVPRGWWGAGAQATFAVGGAIVGEFHVASRCAWLRQRSATR